MPNKPTRRQIIGAAAVTAAALAVPSRSAAQSGHDKGVESVDQELAMPLSPEAKKLLVEALNGSDTAAKDRLKTKLPENSEPCFTYFAAAREVREK